MKRRILFFLLIIILPSFLFAQDLSTGSYNSHWAKKIPVLTLSNADRALSLPVSVDNSLNMYFPGVLDQGFTATCQQYAGVCYCFGYENARARNLNGKDSTHSFPAAYTFNYMNHGVDTTGVSFFYSWDVIRHQGHPVNSVYDDYLLGTRGWLSGYEKYHEGMKNRIKQVNKIPVNTDEGILTLKHYLFDHLEGSATGGLALFGASPPFGNAIQWIPLGTPEGGKPVVPAFYPLATHAMTIVGYNDSIRFDVNNDGQFTNNIDLNNDGIITPADYEFGAYRVVNSYGSSWYDTGFIWVMYRAMAMNFNYNSGSPWGCEYGAWENSVFTVEPVVGYEPLLTMKTDLNHSSREMISVRAGISANPMADFPDHTMNFMIWNFQGGAFPVNAAYPGPEGVEAGFDITPLLSYVNPGDTAKLFFLLEEQDKNHTGHGMINNAEFISYQNGNSVSQVAGSGMDIEDNSFTILSALVRPEFSKPAITTPQLPSFDPSQNYSFQMAATGGKPPYSWSVLHPVLKIETDSAFPQDVTNTAEIEGITVPYHELALPFPFEFYGKIYDTVYMNAYGFLCFSPDAIPDHYVSDPEQTIRNYPIISGALSRDCNISHPQAGMWYKEGTHDMTFRWKIMMSHSGSLMNFAIRLYDDGRFEILYDECSGDNRLNASCSGYSAGDDNDFCTWTNWKPEELTGKRYLFIPAGPPAAVKISQEGELTASGLDTEKMYDLLVEVKDENQISSVRSFSLSNDLVLEASVSGNIIRNQDNPVKLQIKNTSAAVLSGINISMKRLTSGILTPDSSETVPSLAPGETIDLPGAFVFRSDSAFPDQYPLRFLLKATSGSRTWEKEVVFPFSGPNLSFGSPVIHDGVDGFLDPGEVAEMFVDVNNMGSAGMDSVEFRLEAPGHEIAVLDSASSHMISLEPMDKTRLHFLLRASRSVNTGDSVALSLSGYRNGEMVKKFDFILETGKIRTAIMDLSVNGHSSMDSALTALNVSHDIFTYVPETLNNYQYAFVVMGSGLPDPLESSLLLSYPDSARNMYIEGYIFWKMSTNSNFRRIFHDSIHTVTSYPLARISGVGGTPAGTMTFSYQGTPANSNYEFIPLEPAYALLETPLQRPVANIFPGEDHTLISSIIQFKGLADSVTPSDRVSLMKTYLELMGMQIGGPEAFFHSDRTSIAFGDSIHFYDDSFEDITGWQWEFEGGFPAVSAEQNPVVKYLSQGKYDVKLTVTNSTGATVIEKKDFISVGLVNLVAEINPDKSLVIWPNPASGTIWIETGSDINHLEIFNLQGRKVLEKDFSGKTGSADVHNLPSGMYIILVNGIREKLIRH